jgi:glycerol uptake facilitator-like aquaporin
MAELVGTALLLAMVVGSGIMAQRLFEGSAGSALLVNSLATGAGLTALILAFGAVSAQFNPVVTLTSVATGTLARRDALGLIAAQVMGGVAGVMLAHVMFDLPVLSMSRQERTGVGQLAGEVVATFGLILVIEGCRRTRPSTVAPAVGAYIASAYWFTSSTSFANPAVTLARALTETFAGIRPVDVVPFILAQCVGAALGALVSRHMHTGSAGSA